jgi:two-component system nitrogen regulation response regulator GlnG
MESVARMLTERDVLKALGGHQPPLSIAPLPGTRATEPSNGVQVELTRQQIERALQQAGGNRTAAARTLGISRRALYRRLRTFGLG